MEPCQQYVLDEMSFHKEYNTSQISSTVTDKLKVASCSVTELFSNSLIKSSNESNILGRLTIPEYQRLSCKLIYCLFACSSLFRSRGSRPSFLFLNSAWQTSKPAFAFSQAYCFPRPR